ncbi:MAG: hypothetical protein C5B58_13205 [Acidobacteria bacterium]|nr:MAG: hypothetical protein C5B58_13205 [Acidobacteriota bacterium]
MTIVEATAEFKAAAAAKGDFHADPAEDHALWQMAVAFHFLSRQGEAGRSAFAELLYDPSPNVRRWVSAQLLSEADTRAIPVAEQLSREKGNVGLSAQVVLDEFRAGRLRSPFATHVPLYKYRSLSNWKFVTDILVNRRLYAAPFRSLNDPMEGRLYYFDDSVARRYRRAIKDTTARLNICSLCANKSNALLWSYYADGHSGIAIGVTVRTAKRPRVDPAIEVRYDQSMYIEPENVMQLSPSEVATEVLRQKLQAWEHENEYRVFTTQAYVPVVLHELILGCAVKEAEAQAFRELAKKLVPDVHVTQMKRADLSWPGIITNFLDS